MTSQELILARIADAVAGDANLTLIHDREYANTGTLRTLDTATLAQVGAVCYDFQQNSCHFGPQGNRVAALRYGMPATSKGWVKGSIPEVVDAVVAHLRGAK